MAEDQKSDGGSLTLAAVQKIAISPEKAAKIAKQYQAAARKSNPTSDDLVIEHIVAQKIIGKYSMHTALSGGAWALPGIIPGIGTAVSAVGGGLGDAALCLKYQVDMTMVLAANHGWDLTELDAQYMATLIALFGSIEKFGKGAATPMASKAGVRLLRKYLTGPSLEAVKRAFKIFQINFYRSSIERALPFGVGVGMGSTLNYFLTRHVGREAVKCFTIDQQLGPDGVEAAV